jgi:F0F1-type ATP synthase assembly protein I
MKSLNKLIVPRKQVTGADSLNRGTEIALTVLVFTVIGLLLDSAFGVMPWITISLVVFSLVGNFIRMYYTYTAKMSVLEAQRREMSSPQSREATAK